MTGVRYLVVLTEFNMRRVCLGPTRGCGSRVMTCAVPQQNSAVAKDPFGIRPFEMERNRLCCLEQYYLYIL